MIINFWCKENLSDVTYKKGTGPIAQMEYESDKIDKAVDITLEPDEFSSSFTFAYGDSGAGILFEDDPSKLTAEQLKVLMEKVCAKIADEEDPDFEEIVSVNVDGKFYPERTRCHIKEFSCNENLSQYTDAMLFDSGEVIASMDYFDDEKNKGITMVLEVRGHVNVSFDGVDYYHASEFPEELTKLIKKDPDWMNNERVYVSENNWFEFIFSYSGCSCSDGIMMDDDISKMFTSQLETQMATLCRNLLKEAK